MEGLNNFPITVESDYQKLQKKYKQLQTENEGLKNECSLLRTHVDSYAKGREYLENKLAKIRLLT